MFGFGQLIDILKKSPKKIVFTEGNDPRILEAASRLLASNFLSRFWLEMRLRFRKQQRRADLIFAEPRLSIHYILKNLMRWLPCSVN